MWFEFYQEAADEVGGNLHGGAGAEGLGKGWELLGVRGGYGSGWVRLCLGVLTPTGGWAIMGALTPHRPSDVRRATQGVYGSRQG